MLSFSNFTSDMVPSGQNRAISSARGSNSDASQDNTPYIADSLENMHPDILAMAFDLFSEFEYRMMTDWRLWQVYKLPLFIGRIISSDDSELCLSIALRIMRGQSYRFKAKGKIYEIDPQCLKFLENYFHKTKAENPRKLLEGIDGIKAGDISSAIIERGDA